MSKRHSVFMGFVNVFLHHQWASNADLAHLAGWHFLTLLVKQGQLNPNHRRTT